MNARRRLQFSLLAVLATMTIVSVCLGIWISLIIRKETGGLNISGVQPKIIIEPGDENRLGVPQP
jgi:hypothetical protein